MSCHTSTWASQFGPAPIPTVGMVSLPVIWVANSAGTISITTENAPASATAIASATVCSAPSPRPCTRKPPRVLTLCGVKPMWAITGMPAAVKRGDLLGDPFAALQLDRMRAGFLHEPDRGVQRRGGSGFVAAERQVGDHQSVRCTSHHATHQRDQLVDRDGHRGVVAVDDVGGRITDQQHRDAGVVEDSGSGVVVSRQHRPLVAFGLHLLQVLHAHLGPRRGGGVTRLRRSSPINRVLRHHCP